MSEPTKEQVFDDIYHQYLDEMEGIAFHACDSYFGLGGPKGAAKRAARHMVEQFHSRQNTRQIGAIAAPSPGPDIKPEGNNAPLSGPRAISAKEVEEAMARMPDAILCAYAFRMGHTRATIPSVSEATYDNEADEAALALIKAALSTPSPPLPEEAEAAIIRIEDCIEDAFAHRQNHTDKSYPIDEVQKDSVKDFDALAVIRAAIRPKIVTRERVEKIVIELMDFGSHVTSAAFYLSAMLRELGIEVER